MRLYLVRHADAAPGEPDALRPLTPRGRAHARALGERLAALTEPPRVVLTSPLLRARETGALIAAALGVEPEAVESLAPGATADDVRAAARRRGGDLVVVAHQPDCSHVAAELTGGPEPSFAPGTMLELELAP